MGFGGISIWQLLIILAIIVLLFGTKKLRNIGSDLGNAVKGFKKAVNTHSGSDVSKESDNDTDSKKNEQLTAENNGKTDSPKDNAKIVTDKS